MSAVKPGDRAYVEVEVTWTDGEGTVQCSIGADDGYFLPDNALLPVPDLAEAPKNQVSAPGVAASDETTDGQANTCSHSSATGVDQTALDDPAKVWACDHCGLRWTPGRPEATRREAEIEPGRGNMTLEAFYRLPAGSIVAKTWPWQGENAEPELWQRAQKSNHWVEITDWGSGRDLLHAPDVAYSVGAIHRIIYRADQITNEGDE